MTKIIYAKATKIQANFQEETQNKINILKFINISKFDWNKCLLWCLY